MVAKEKNGESRNESGRKATRDNKPEIGREALIKQVIVVRKDVKMGLGKVAAQASHASLEAYLVTARKWPRIAENWLSTGQTKIVVKTRTEAEFMELKRALSGSEMPFAVVRDAGQTQVPPGTETAIGIGPFYSEKIDQFTGDFQLL